jgi:5-methylcytosine-specific restriction protein A
MRPYDGAWRRIRPVILARDAYQCQIRLPVCTGRATQVDHIIEPDDGGAWHDPRNLRAACAQCNASKGGTHGNRKRWGGTPSRDW